MPPLITAQNISKTYTRRQKSGGWLRSFLTPETIRIEALKSVSFEIAQGELIGYIGPNGAGKSTTVKILSGILVPDAGECTVLGLTPWRERIRAVARIGVVFGQRSQLWWDLPVIDSFDLLRDIYRVPQLEYRKTRDALIDRLALTELLTVPVRQLSLGQRMRCELAASLLHAPDILFLDEPTIGLDAVSKLAVRDFLREANRERGLTAILTTHDMDDIEALCSRVLLIGQGQILLDGTVRDLLTDGHERRIRARLTRPLAEDALPPGISAQALPGGEWLLRFDPEQVPAADIIALLNERFGVLDIIVENPPIDEVIARRYERLGAS